MTAIASARLTDNSTEYPAMATLNSAANSLYYKGTLVSRDADGRAAVPSDGDGLPVAGVSCATIDNRTVNTQGHSGLDDGPNIELRYGVYAFVMTGTAPLSQEVVYVVDNQTVSINPLSSSGAPRGRAGVCVFVETVNGVSQCFVWIAPGGAGAAAAAGHLNVPIAHEVIFIDGTSNGVDPVVFGFRYNNTVDDEPLKAIVAFPENFDTTRDVTITARSYITSVATDDDVVMVLVARWEGGDDDAPVATQILAVAPAADYAFTLSAADIPAGARSLWLELDCAATLDTADAVVESLRVGFSKTI